MLWKRLAAVLVVLAFVGAACGRNDDPSIDAGSAEAEHNDADVEFAQGMIPHHEQAVEMADLAATKASAPEVKELAARIRQAQGPEITTMKGWLEDWGEELQAEGGEHAGMDKSGMSGMMSEEEMTELEGASGESFDRMFLTMMVRHHESAIDMAETELEEGKFPPAKDLARQIATSQQAEIDEMKALLAAAP